MPRSRKKAGRGLNRNRLSKVDLGDVTVNDFANCPVSTASERLKKNTDLVKQVAKEVKQLNLVEDEKTWEDKINDLGISAEKECASVKKSVKKNSSKNKEVSLETEDSDSGFYYPIKIWFLISEYIPPECVGKFAAICSTSYAITKTVTFWLKLYKRYYRNVANMPEQLKPECMGRHYGLRARVIRALHFMHPPFREKLKPQVSFDGDPHLLTKHLCLLAWFQKIEKHWLFSFKLKKVKNTRYGICVEESKEENSLLEMNQDENCKVLQVTCSNFINLPMLSGQILSKVALRVSRGMCHTLQLSFGSGPCPSESSNPVIFHPVLNIRVLNWWHPEFPHFEGIDPSLLDVAAIEDEYDELDF